MSPALRVSSAPSVASDDGKRRWWARWERASASPGALETHIAWVRHLDVRPLLPLVRVPVLAMHRLDDVLRGDAVAIEELVGLAAARELKIALIVDTSAGENGRARDG